KAGPRGRELADDRGERAGVAREEEERRGSADPHRRVTGEGFVQAALHAQIHGGFPDRALVHVDSHPSVRLRRPTGPPRAGCFASVSARAAAPVSFAAPRPAPSRKASPTFQMLPAPSVRTRSPGRASSSIIRGILSMSRSKRT